MNPRKLTALFLFVFSLAAPLAVLAARPIPFSDSHPQYMAALARAFAQEVEQNAGIKPSDLDEQFTPEDFGLTEVGLLPNNPLYLFKAVRRGFSDALTRNPAEKLQNSLRFAAEKLLEAEALSQSGARETLVASALDGFKREINRARARARAAAASAELGDSAEGAEVGRAMMDAVIKYEKLIGRIEKGTSGNAVSAAAEAKGSAAEALGAAFAFVPPEDAAETLSGVFDAQRGSDFKEFKNLEVLKTIEEKAPESAKAAIHAAQENELAKLEGNLDAAGAGSRTGFGDIVQNIGGNEARHLEIINDLEVRPLSEATRATLSAAKEEVLSRAETRLTGLSETEKRAFLGHLNDGNIEDLRVVNELEKNVSAEALSGVSDLASSAQESFMRRVESAATNAGEREKLFESVERFHDAKSLSVLDEIAALIPPEQQAVFAALKQKAASEIQKDISQATSAAQERAYYQALGGDHPEEFKALESVGGVSGEILQGIRSATTEQIKSRAGVIRDEARFGKYEEALRTSSGEAGISAEELATFFAEQRDIYGSRGKVERKIAEAETLVNALSELASSLPLNLGYGEEGFDPAIRDAARLLSSAEGRLATARAALARNAFGLAYGEAQEAAFAARDGANIARSYKAGRRVIVPVPVMEKEKPIPLPILDLTEEDLDKLDKDKAISCQAYFEGFVFDEKVGACKKQSASGCSNPFVYSTKEQCETAIDAEGREGGKNQWVEHAWRFADGIETSMILDRTDTEYRSYIKNVEATCRLMPKQQFLWRKGAGNDAPDNWKNFGIPDCSGQAFAPANCGNNICELGETTAKCPKDCAGGKKAEDTYSCPGFAHERIDSKGKRYCQLNARAACSYAFPKFLYEDSYASSLCPTATTGVTDDTAATSTRQFENCGSHTSRLGCEFKSACDWYIPTQGSAYCAPAVRNAWISHTWRFSDSGTETSSILSRTDREYSEFIASVDTQCKTITRSKFAWKPGAGNDAPDNWQNFGIPDCSRTASGGNSGGGYGGDANSCPGFAWSQWDKNGRRYCQLNSEYKCDYAYPSYLVNGPNYKNTNCPSELVETATTTQTGTPQCSDGKDNDNDGKTDYPNDTSCYGRDDWDEWYPSSTTGGGGTTSMQKCFYPNASKNGVSVGYTVWCESDYVGCRKGSKDGEAISITGVSLGTPSSCESGWTGGSGSCNNNKYCDTWESKAVCPVECENGPGTYTTGTCNNNNYCDTWENATACPSECSGGGGGTSTTCDSALTTLLGTGCHQMSYDSSGAPIFCDGPMTKSAKRGNTTTTNGCAGSGSGGGTTSGGTPAIPTGVTASAPSTGNTVEIRWTDASISETYFKIWRQVNSSWAFLTSVPSSNNAATGAIVTYTDSGVPSGSINYQIQACNDIACSQDSALAYVWVAGGGGTTASYCGDRVCNASESASSCPTDCGSTGGGGTTTTNPACSDGRDNDGDGQTDYPSDTGCYSAADTDEAYYPGGGGTSSTTCDSATTALLGTGCHSMGNAFFNSEMTKYVWPGGSTVLECSTGHVSGCSGSGGGTTSGSQCSDGVDNDSDSFIDGADPGCQNGGTSETYYGSSTTTCASGQYWNGSACVSSSTSTCGNHSCESGETTASCPADCGSTTTSDSTSTHSTCASGQYWNGTSCVASTQGASVWQAFSSWLRGE